MTTQTLNRADYCYSEASELLNLPTATIIDMVNNGILEHTGCGKRITRDSLQAAMAPESEEKWLHGEKSDGWIKEADTTLEKGQCVPQPQPGWVINEFRDIGWRTIGPGGYVIVLNEDYEEFRGAYDLTWEDLPDCTGFDYVPPPEETPAEKLLRKAGVAFEPAEYDEEEETYRFIDQMGNYNMITIQQAGAIAAHMREREGGAE